jgi:hypothetical protein
MGIDLGSRFREETSGVLTTTGVPPGGVTAEGGPTAVVTGL